MLIAVRIVAHLTDVAAAVAPPETAMALAIARALVIHNQPRSYVCCDPDLDTPSTPASASSRAPSGAR